MNHRSPIAAAITAPLMDDAADEKTTRDALGKVASSRNNAHHR